MATSAVEICNNALIRVGSDRITSLSDTTERAVLVNERYEKCRDDLLRSHPWNFAIGRSSLAEDSSTPIDGFDHQYILPVDCLRVLLLNEDPGIIWSVETGGLLLTDESSVKIKYIKKITDTTLFDKNFEEVLGLKIAKAIAYRLSQSSTLVAQIDADMKDALRAARSFDAQEGSVITFVADDWFNSRY